MKLSDYVIQFISNLGVRHVFLVAGAGAMHLNDSLARCRDIEFVCNLHEQASAIAAECYAKATNHLGVAMLTTGPGGTNAITGLAGAWLDSTPCLFLSGQVKRPDRMYTPEGAPLGVRQLGMQEVDIVSIVRPLTKYAVTVTDPQTIRYHLEKSLHLAQTGRPGPVWIDIPLDVQVISVDEKTLPGFNPEELPPAFNATVLQQKVREVIEALNRSERPILLVGNGIRLARAQELFQYTLTTLDVPVATTWCARDLVAEDNPLFVGRPGGMASRGANFAIQNSDFLLAVGTRLDFSITGYAPDKFARAACKVMVDIDPTEIAKLGRIVDIPVSADAGAFLRELLSQRAAIRSCDRFCWKTRCADWIRRYPVVLPEHRTKGGLVSTYRLSEVLFEESTSEDFVAAGSSGFGIEIFHLAFPSRLGQRIFHTAALGAMGFGIPAAVGVCLAGGRRRTICVDGDGGFQLNIQELETVARLQLPIKFFVLNNQGYASIRASQRNYFGAENIGCDPATGLTLPDLSKVARSYGIKAVMIRDQAGVRSGVRRVLRQPGPVICDVRVIPDEIRAPRLSSVQRSDGSFVSRPLEDLWPFLDREEFRENMIVPPLED
jgi:acetolactate synthase I/II/III large subunit